MQFLSEQDRQAVIALARESLVEAVLHKRQLRAFPANNLFAQPRGVFVTIRVQGQLRGCMGVMHGVEALSRAIARCTLQAANDARFKKVEPEELEAAEIEISILSELESTRPEEIEIGKHGLVIERGEKHGLLLPQVAAERGFDAVQFLQATCEKAGLPRDSWKEPETSAFRFACDVIRESTSRNQRL